jgi:hypothetical protein
MTEVANAPEPDKFQTFTLHESDKLIYPHEGYLDINYTQDIIFIQVFWVSGRTRDTKKALFRRISDDLHARAHVRKEDVWIV